MHDVHAMVFDRTLQGDRAFPGILGVLGCRQVQQGAGVGNRSRRLFAGHAHVMSARHQSERIISQPLGGSTLFRLINADGQEDAETMRGGMHGSGPSPQQFIGGIRQLLPGDLLQAPDRLGA